jgi:hypothetical protein
MCLAWLFIMDKECFILDIDGRKAACVKDGKVYRIESIYLPVFIEPKEGEGTLDWMDANTGDVTPLSQKLGGLIVQQRYHKMTG